MNTELTFLALVSGLKRRPVLVVIMYTACPINQTMLSTFLAENICTAPCLSVTAMTRVRGDGRLYVTVRRDMRKDMQVRSGCSISRENGVVNVVVTGIVIPRVMYITAGTVGGAWRYQLVRHGDISCQTV